MVNKVKELYHYREMIYSLVKRELRGKYKASVLGFFWTFLNPLLQMLVYLIVFSVIMRSGIEHFAIYLFVGLMPWNFFSMSITGGAACVVNQDNLIKKIYFPRIILPISYVTSMFINMLLTFVVVFVVLIVSGYGINLLAICFLPIVMVLEYIITLGLTMLFSALTVYLRDLEYVLGIVAMAWLYLTPIFYSAEQVPEQYLFLFNLNPMKPIIENYQQILYWKQIPTGETLGYATIFGVVILILGILIFEKLQKKFVEAL